MSKINILDKSIFNRIAAGEVVEKPASVVKELVENSIDAGATKISIEIIEGGIKQIIVSDNGCGIEPDDMVKAFLPHATSKICTANDLDKIGTLGFRGEALSSIASVSKVNLISKVKNLDIGNEIILEGGEVISQNEKGCSDGTYISVSDLFYCVPARAKFLRKPKTEESDVTNIVSRLILANPNIQIKYTADNKLVYFSSGNGIEEAIYAIYGKDVLDNLIKVDFNSYDKLIHFNGYICKPTFSKPNRTYQTLIINGRYVINQQISTAIYKAYENFLMKGNFPFFVLYVTLPLDKVDVNVHPNKQDVKFEKSGEIFALVVNAISEILYGINHIKNIEDESEEQNENVDFNLKDLQDLRKVENVSLKTTVVDNVTLKEKVFDEEKFNQIKENLNSYLSKQDKHNEVTFKSDNGYSYDLAMQAYKNMQQQSFISNSDTNSVNDNKIKLDDFKIIGTLFNTYILVEQDKNLLMIDQHAGHERLLYDKFKKQFEEHSLLSQSLLVPYILNLNFQEWSFINENLTTLKNLGFDIEGFGNNSFKINSVPLLLKDINIADFFNSILHDINNNLIIKKTDLMEEYLAKSACRSAVKANDNLSYNEIEILLNLLSKENQVLLCPHGRPIVLKITNTEIEKWFKRLV